MPSPRMIARYDAYNYPLWCPAIVAIVLGLHESLVGAVKQPADSDTVGSSDRLCQSRSGDGDVSPSAAAPEELLPDLPIVTIRTSHESHQFLPDTPGFRGVIHDSSSIFCSVVQLDRSFYSAPRCVVRDARVRNRYRGRCAAVKAIGGMVAVQGLEPRTRGL